MPSINLAKFGELGSPFEGGDGQAFLPEGHQRGLDYLRRTFRERKAAAVLSGAGRMAVTHVVEEFLDSLDRGVIKVRIAEGTKDPRSLLHAVLRGVGLRAGKLSLADLENMLAMFLVHMNRNGDRLIVCIEDFERADPWVLDQAGRLIALERQGHYGMMVLMVGKLTLAGQYEDRTTSYMGPELGGRFTLPRLSVTETRGYLRRQLRLAGGELVELFDFHAVDRIHEYCAGVIDGVLPLAHRALQMASASDAFPITTDQIQEAAEALRLDEALKENDEESEDGLESPWLVARVNGETVQTLSLEKDRILLGRDESCDLRVTQAAVSSHHAMVVQSPQGPVLIDLRSANGTAVNGRIIAKHVLADRDVIGLGTARIEFRAGRKDPQRHPVRRPARSQRVVSLLSGERDAS